MRMVGNLICQDGVDEIRRCLESVAPLVDEYYVCDGGSTDGTWELLNEYKDAYNLTLFQNEYKGQGKQRNFLLDKTPKDCWVLNIDCDEQINSQMFYQLNNFLDRVTPELYTDPKRELVLTVSVNCINLVKDINHYDASRVSNFATKLFYNDRNAHFTDTYHMTICYDDDFHDYTNSLHAPMTWAIRHYAYLDPERLANKKVNDRSYKDSEFNPDNWEIRKLPRAWRY